MDIRSYTKQELALLYFPDLSPVVASAHLMRWICRNPDLLKKLHAINIPVIIMSSHIQMD